MLPKFVQTIRRCAAALLIACAAPSAHAWGAVGHELIAEAAWRQLPPRTQQRIEQLLAQEPGETLASIASWADRVRSPSTARWHYVNFPRGAGCSYDAERDCEDGHCVVAAIERQAQRLATAPSPEEQLIALKWLVHLVGDVHQPLHAGFADDKGGNLLQLQAFGRGTNLHALWDTGIVSNWPGGIDALRAEVRRQLPAAATQGVAVDWAAESCRIVAAPAFAPDSRIVTAADLATWRPIVARRLADSAARLAILLQRVLG